MSLLLSSDELAARRSVANGGLRPLTASLLADLDRVIEAPLYVPERKALLSRDGGRCPRDGTMLDFDPFKPTEHRCPRCRETYRGDGHDGFWVYWYQLWLAERAVHGALLGYLSGNAAATKLALAILDEYAERYLKYPNVDNALGPTRPFFSTYLESIWLLQLCIATDVVEKHVKSSVTSRFRDRVVEPSLKLIHSFDEGLSNRQVWNNAALIAANRLLARDGDAEAVVWAESGLVTHLATAMLPDGTWYEGENYHLFAHRGLWYCMEMARQVGAELPDDLAARYEAGFRTPFLTSLPDLTFPSRRDSQYAISLRQWRFAEMCELGLARSDDRLLRGMLSRLYAPDIEPGDTGRWKSTAEAERNLAPARLDRSDLGWKSLLFARPSLELRGPVSLPSVLLEAQGVGVLRRDEGRVFAALDYGISGGGHGHPDRLNLLLMNGEDRLLDDFGTGSYVDPSLHWYRSSLAHNAPFFDGQSQPRMDGELRAFEDRGGAGWIGASAHFGHGREVTRTIVAMPDYLVDEVEWSAARVKSFDLPLHLDATPVDSSFAWTEGWLPGSDGLEDGFRFLKSTRKIAIDASMQPVHLRAIVGTTTADVWLAGDGPLELWRGIAPGAPGRGDMAVTLIRSAAPRGKLRLVWSWAGAVRSVSLFPQIGVTTAEAVHTHARVAHGWNIGIDVAGARSSIDLEGLRANVPDEAPAVHVPEEREAVLLRRGSTIHLTLREESYRRSESTWEEAGKPTARVEITNSGRGAALAVTVENADRSFVLPSATNTLDNESADINGAGLQLYLRTDDAAAGYLLVPDTGSDRVHIRAIDGWGGAVPVRAHWSPMENGYLVRIDVDCDSAAEFLIELDLVVNEKPEGRARRRGQLVLSGGAGEFIYLRGDRHDPARLIPFLLTND